LKMPEVVYVTTRPEAAMAYTEPAMTPYSVYWNSFSTGAFLQRGTFGERMPGPTRRPGIAHTDER
jgi:hypothetical protein